MTSHQNEKQGGLAKNILLKVMLRTSIVIFILSLVSYIHVYGVLKSGAIDSLDAYISQRALRDRELFKLAESNMERFKYEFLRIWNNEELFVPSPADLQRFETGRDAEGFYKSQDRDMEHEPSTFVDNEAKNTETLVRKILILEHLVPTLHAAWRDNFSNLYGVVRDGVIVKHWPGRDYASEIPATMELNEQAWVTIGYPENNPTRESKWTGVFYDAPATKYMTAVETPIYDGDEYLMNVGTDLLLDEIVERNLKDKIEGTYNILFQEDGTIIAHPDLLQEIMDTQGTLKIQDTKIDNLKEIYRLVSENSSDRVIDVEKFDQFIAIGKYNEPGWYLVTVYPKSLLVDQAMGIAMVILLIGLISVVAEVIAMHLVIKKNVVTPVHNLMVATEEVTNGGTDFELDIERNDELGRLGKLFSNMASTVNEHRTNLEAIVEERTQAIVDREQSIELMLDNSGSGFLTTDLQGHILPPLSATALELFGSANEQTLFWDYLIADDDEATKKKMRFMFEAMIEDPEFQEIYLKQLPTEFRRDNSTFSVKYRTISSDDNTIEKIMIIVDDITGLMKANLAEKSQKEILSLFNRFIDDPGVSESFVTEMNRLVQLAAQHAQSDHHLLAQIIHTIKGNAYTYDVNSIGGLCHHIEEEMVRDPELIGSKVDELVV